MNKQFKSYLIAWAFMLAVFNAVVFAVRALPGYEIVYDTRFWFSWGFVIAAYLGQLACAWVVCKSENKEKLFLNIPLIRESYGATVLMTVAAGICMLIPDCPAWIAVVVCGLIFAFSVMAIIKAQAAAQLVAEADQKVRVQTFFIRSLTADAQSLLARAANEEMEQELQKVYDEVRYSDPMSSEALAADESQIMLKFKCLTQAVAANDLSAVKSAACEVVALIEVRNRKCRELK